MGIDLLIVLIYFVLVFTIAIRGRIKKPISEISSDEYFLSSRNLSWTSIAISTIATNVGGNQMLAMMGSAYVFGLAQANFEINAIQGIWMAAFIFVPLYLRSRVTTITQFVALKLGNRVARTYSVVNILLFSTIGLGGSLFLGAYAAELSFVEYTYILHPDPFVRVCLLVAILGLLSAIYTYFGGLSAVVRTDIIQFVILFTGGLCLLFVAVNQLGGWGQLYEKTPQLMHLHLPADHPKLPWVGMLGLALLNINYWCANQTIVQRSLAARSLADAQKGLLLGSVMKIIMAIIIVVPGIALFGILPESEQIIQANAEDFRLNELTGQMELIDPDQAFPLLVRSFLPVGIRGLILCALFASLMSTVDSTFNSLATLFSVDILKDWLRPQISDADMVQAGRSVIVATLITGVSFGCILAWVKYSDSSGVITLKLTDFRAYFNSGIVIAICSAAFLVVRNKSAVLFAFLLTIPMQIVVQYFLFPEMNFLIRALIVIVSCFAIAAIFNPQFSRREDVLVFGSTEARNWGWLMIFILALLHLVFH